MAATGLNDTASTVGLSAVADPENANRLVLPVEADSIVSHAEALRGRVDALEPLDVARAGVGEALYSLLDSACDSLIERRHIFQRRLSPFDSYHVRPSLRMASPCGMPLPPRRASQSRASATACLSSSLSGSLSMGALRRAAAKGSTMVSSSQTSAESCVSGRRSIKW
jgi:hypothetical protein